MGLDATVMCNCYARGLTAPPPHRDHVRVDDEGYLGIDLPWDTHRDENDAFDTWLSTACPHERMELVSERISNWGGFRTFQEALEVVGWDRLPTLRAVLPTANGGVVSADDSARCLDELRTFEECYCAHVPTLFDTKTGAVLHHYIQAYQGVFILDGKSGVNVGLDERGLFVVERDSQCELFRAMRIEQRPVMVAGREGSELVDLDAGARITIGCRIHGDAIPWPDGRMQDDERRWRFSEPARLHVATAERSAESLAYILTSLRTVFGASVETGNPVRWT